MIVDVNDEIRLDIDITLPSSLIVFYHEFLLANHFHLSNLSLFMNFFISGSALMHSRLAFTR